MTVSLSHRSRPGASSAGRAEQGPTATAEPVASPGILLAGDATGLVTSAGRATETTTFTAQRAGTPRAEARHERRLPRAHAPAGTRPSLLIADDDPVVRMMLKLSLGDEFELAGMAGDTEEAIELARVRQPDAALLDVVMPRGGGLRAARGILEVAPDTAVVMLSGYSADGLIGLLIQAGAVAYRRKGVAPRLLADTLTESIKVHTAERRESAWKLLSWYCLGLNRRSRQPPRAGEDVT